MTTLMKRRNRNRLTSPLAPLSSLSSRLLSPWNTVNRPLSLWNNSLFPSRINELQNLFELDDVFNGDFFEEDSLMPSMNVKEHNDDFEIEIAAPGFTKKDFEVSIDGNVLNVSGEKNIKEEEENEDFTCKEFSYKSFKRSLALPETVDLDQNVKATYKNGILQMNLAKKEEAKKLTRKKVIEIA